MQVWRFYNTEIKLRFSDWGATNYTEINDVKLNVSVDVDIFWFTEISSAGKESSG